ncbi:MAG: hypothetical protein K9L30_17260 [Desulfobacterales bacterium]|nr:hypothetical protein [Desulfobacterales bacterium]
MGQSILEHNPGDFYATSIAERILSDISQSDLPAKEFFAEHMRQRYRSNGKLSSLRTTASSTRHFLSFYQEKGKQHIEQMTREEIEAYTEVTGSRVKAYHGIHDVAHYLCVYPLFD